jgi:hypothetical protein
LAAAGAAEAANVQRTSRRLAIIAGATIIVVAAAGLIARQVIVETLKSRVVAVLGPLGTADSIDVTLSEIRLRNVRLRGFAGWPAGDTLQAKSVVIVPELRQLLSHRVHIDSITVDDFYLSVLHSADGRVVMLPNLKDSLERARQSEDGNKPKTDVFIGRVDMRRGSLDFYDAALGKNPPKVHLHDVQASVAPLHFPALAERTNLQFTGLLSGPAHTGTVDFAGWIVLSSKDSQTTTTLKGVDLVTLQSYLLKHTEADIGSGVIDMSLQATVRDYMLHAPGTMTLTGLTLKSDAGGALGTFMALPKQAVVAALKDHRGRINLQFSLDGNLHDPHFSLREDLATRLGAGLAKALGVSVQGVAEGAGETVKSIGETLRGIFGK